MGIKTLQQRLTQVGVIRLGEKRLSKNNKPYPARLETLRFTSPSRDLIASVAAAYGGEVKPWQGNTGPEWEVVTKVKEIPVLVPPQRIDPNLEHWGNGFRDRLCDGETEKMRNKPCLCAAAVAAGRPFGVRDTCKPTTRCSLMLANIPSLGTWKLEARGWNAAAELPSLAGSVENAPFPVPARLVVQVRDKKDFDPSKSGDDAIELKVFVVPVLLFDWLTPAQAFGGELDTAARAALTGETGQQPAIEAADPGHRKFTPQEYITLAGAAEDIDHVRELWRDAAHDEALTDAVKDALNAKVAEIQRKQQPKPAQSAERPAQPSEPAAEEPTDVVDAEEAPDPDAVWQTIIEFAGELSWTADALERQVQQHLKKSSDEADGFELTRFLDALRAGEIK